MRSLLLIAVLMLLQGCAPKSLDKLGSAENEAEVIKMFNEGQYDKAVFLLEAKYGRDPTERNNSFLLAQAHLGKAGFEPLAFAGRVSGVQGPGPKTALFPECDKGAIRSFQQVGLECMMDRIYRHAPDADDPSFARARALFRRAYPSAQDAPEWVNTLIGLVELVSSIDRHGKTFVLGLTSDRASWPMSLPLEKRDAWLKEQSRLGTEEANQAIKRAQYAGDRIAKFVKGNRSELSLLTAEAAH